MKDAKTVAEIVSEYQPPTYRRRRTVEAAVETLGRELEKALQDLQDRPDEVSPYHAHKRIDRTDQPGNDIFVDNCRQPGDDPLGRSQFRRQQPGRLLRGVVQRWPHRFDYGAWNTNLTPTIGIFAGNGLAYVLSAYDGRTSLTNAPSVQFGLAPGYREPGAYVLRIGRSRTAHGVAMCRLVWGSPECL